MCVRVCVCVCEREREKERERESLRSVMTKVPGCGLEISESEIQSPYNDHFLTNSLRKGMNPLIIPLWDK